MWDNGNVFPLPGDPLNSLLAQGMQTLARTPAGSHISLCLMKKQELAALSSVGPGKEVCNPRNSWHPMKWDPCSPVPPCWDPYQLMLNTDAQASMDLGGEAWGAGESLGPMPPHQDPCGLTSLMEPCSKRFWGGSL